MRNAAAAPATVSGEPKTNKPLGRNAPGKAVRGGDPRARRPAIIRGHARKRRAGCTEAVEICRERYERAVTGGDPSQ